MENYEKTLLVEPVFFITVNPAQQYFECGKKFSLKKEFFQEEIPRTPLAL